MNFRTHDRFLFRVFKRLWFRLWIRSVAATPALRYAHSDNMVVLGGVSDWMTGVCWDKTIFNYGVPESIRPLLNLPLGDGLTYSDWMVAQASALAKPIQYLEIGVSLGKNFFQMAQALQNASLTAFDIENLSPVLADRCGPWRQSDSWSPPSASLRKVASTLQTAEAALTGNQLRYLAADVWDERSWAHLAGSRFNLVFSDALHDPGALIFEMNMLIRNTLLDPDEFIMVWDDLEGRMREGFYDVVQLMKARFGVVRVSVFRLRGWLGENEHVHTIGVVQKRAKGGNGY